MSCEESKRNRMSELLSRHCLHKVRLYTKDSLGSNVDGKYEMETVCDSDTYV